MKQRYLEHFVLRILEVLGTNIIVIVYHIQCRLTVATVSLLLAMPHHEGKRRGGGGVRATILRRIPSLFLNDA